MPEPPHSGPAMAHQATVALEYDGGERREASRGSSDSRCSSDGERRARIVERSLAREVGEIDGDRSTTRLARDGRVVELSIEAADLVALRAATNTWLSLSSVAERVAAAVDDGAADAPGPETDDSPETVDF